MWEKQKAKLVNYLKLFESMRESKQKHKQHLYDKFNISNYSIKHG
jgi:hypothetical protein